MNTVLFKKVIIALGVLACLAEQACFSAQRQFIALDGTVMNVPAGGPASAVTPDGIISYTVDPEHNTVTPADVATGEQGVPIAVGNVPSAIAITPDGAFAYTVNSGDDNVTVIDLATNLVHNPIEVGENPFAITIVDNVAYVFNWGGGTVTPINLETEQAGDPIQSFQEEVVAAAELPVEPHIEPQEQAVAEQAPEIVAEVIEPVPLPVVLPIDLADQQGEDDAPFVPLLPNIIANPEQDQQY